MFMPSQLNSILNIFFLFCIHFPTWGFVKESELGVGLEFVILVYCDSWINVLMENVHPLLCGLLIKAV